MDKGDPTVPNFQLVDENEVAKDIPVVSSQVDQRTEGPCSVCGILCKTRCKSCMITKPGRTRLAPFYCGKEHQEKDWKTHKLTCLKTSLKRLRNSCENPTRAVDHLAICVFRDFLPREDSPCYSTFGFSNCSNESEESKLLGVYVGLLKIINVELDDLHEAATNHTIPQLVMNAFETARPDPSTRGQYYPWFMENHKTLLP